MRSTLAVSSVTGYLKMRTVREGKPFQHIRRESTHLLRLNANTQQRTFTTTTYVNHGRQLVPVCRRFTVLCLWVLTCSPQELQKLLQARPPSDDNPNSNDTFPVQRLKVVEVSVKKGILVVPTPSRQQCRDSPRHPPW